MLELIGSILSLAFGLVKLLLGLAWGFVKLSLGLMLILGVLLLAGSMVLVTFLRHRKKAQETANPDGEECVYDVDSEGFTSFYDQYRGEE